MFELWSQWEPSARWALGLILGTPGVLLVLNEVEVRLRRRGASLEGPVRNLGTFVVPALATLLWLLKVAELGDEALAVRLAETVLWVFVIIAFLSFLNAVVFGQVAEGSWQPGSPNCCATCSRSCWFSSAGPSSSPGVGGWTWEGCLPRSESARSFSVWLCRSRWGTSSPVSC